MSLYLAIDAGGTKTNCVLADGTHILGRASTGTVKLMRVTEEEATASLQGMLEQVAVSAGVSLGDVRRTCFGLAGISSPAVRTWARQELAGIVSGELLLCGDEEIALDAAFPGAPGVLIIAGTGSNVVGRTTAGEFATAGGWGPVLGDEGSGFWIGLAAIRAALHAFDRRGFGAAESGLLSAIQVHWNLDSLSDLIAFGNQRSAAIHPPPDFSTLAPIVARCADQGDLISERILTRAGHLLAEQVSLVLRKMTALDSTTRFNVGVAYTGSVLSNIPAVRATMTSALAAELPEVHIRQTPVDPLDGALWRARHG